MIRALKMKHLFLFTLVIVAIYICDQSGLMLHFHAKDFYKEFQYPMKGDIWPHMEKLRKGQESSVKPINPHDYMMIRQAKGKCIVDDSDDIHKNIRVVYLVKSAMKNFKQREVIRKTWGYEKRFSDVTIKTVFLLGSPEDESKENKYLMEQIKDEYDEYNDIVQGNFVDTYYNNTIKTMMGLRWAAEICPYARFYAFFDDDYYVSTRNMLRFLRNPVNYPQYLREEVINFDDNAGVFRRQLKQMIDFDLPDDVKLYAGHVFHSRPQRHKFSKWYLSLEDYPYSMLPPYVTAGGFVLSKEAMLDFYYASYFVQRFKFDDVYLGLIAKKLEIEPFHCPEFHFYHKPHTIPGYRYVVASHGYTDPEVLEKVWVKQKEAGNA